MSSQPLEGVLVVDLSRYLPGPLTAKMLANLGARVIKVEEPEFGDPVRGAPPLEGGVSSLGRLLLDGVESLALDLKREAALEVLWALLERADVLLESFRPGKLAEFGISGERLSRRAPRLVVCSVSGWGRSGPASARTGHDLSYQAAAGALAATGEVPNVPAADLLGAFAAVSALNAALFARASSGRGSVIDASLFDAAMIANLTHAASVAGRETDEVGERSGLTGAYPCYRVYDTADGRRFALAALEPHFWKRFCRACERQDLIGHQYLRDAKSHRRLAELFAERDAEKWAELCRVEDLPGETVLSVAEAARSGQARARGLETRQSNLQFPALFDGQRPESAPRFPELGADTASLLAEFCPELEGRPARELRAAGIGRRPSLRQKIGRWAAGRLDG